MKELIEELERLRDLYEDTRPRPTQHHDYFYHKSIGVDEALDLVKAYAEKEGLL